MDEVDTLVRKIVAASMQARAHLRESDALAFILRMEDIETNDPNVAEAVLRRPEVAHVLPILHKCYLACVAELEMWWALQVSEERAPLHSYPKYEAYKLRCSIEYAHAQHWARTPLRRAVVVGCGPLPLTVLFLAEQYGMDVLGVDSDESALHLARRLSDALPRTRGEVRWQHGRAEDLQSFADCDLLVLAQSVGTDSSHKDLIVRHCLGLLPPEAVLVLRPPALLDLVMIPELDRSVLAQCDWLDVSIRTRTDTLDRLFLRARSGS